MSDALDSLIENVVLAQAAISSGLALKPEVQAELALVRLRPDRHGRADLGADLRDRGGVAGGRHGGEEVAQGHRAAVRVDAALVEVGRVAQVTVDHGLDAGRIGPRA